MNCIFARKNKKYYRYKMHQVLFFIIFAAHSDSFLSNKYFIVLLN